MGGFRGVEGVGLVWGLFAGLGWVLGVLAVLDVVGRGGSMAFQGFKISEFCWFGVLRISASGLGGFGF